MRHGDTSKKLGRTHTHRRALVKNLVSALIQHERIKTTLPKAQEAQRAAERLVRLARTNTVASRRLAARVVSNKALVKKLFDDIGPRFVSKLGGYTRVLRLGHRSGDSAEVALLEFVVRNKPETERPADGKGGRRAKDKSAGERSPGLRKKRTPSP